MDDKKKMNKMYRIRKAKKAEEQPIVVKVENTARLDQYVDNKECDKLAKAFGEDVGKYILAIAIAKYIINHGTTIKAAAANFNISRSTASRRLELLKDARGYKTLYKNARKVVESHKIIKTK